MYLSHLHLPGLPEQLLRFQVLSQGLVPLSLGMQWCYQKSLKFKGRLIHLFLSNRNDYLQNDVSVSIYPPRNVIAE